MGRLASDAKPGAEQDRALRETVASAMANVDLRVKLAASPHTAESLLFMLARDPATTVRGAVARNPAAPPLADQQLAVDSDEQVRLMLARKVMETASQQDPSGAISRRSYDILASLVQDEAVRIRRLIAEELSQISDAPHALILTLAHDSVISVSEPVLRMSPMLTAADLLALLETPPHRGAVTAIACRAGLPQIVSDAVAASAHDAGIRALLTNPSAAIREETLDILIGRAAAKKDWQEPLVRRPFLPDRLARVLSAIVADELLAVLASRSDLGAELLAELRARLAQRLEQTSVSFPPPSISDTILLEEARALHARGALNETVLLTAARQGQSRWAAAILSVAAAVPLPVIDRAAGLRSAKALVSLIWKAGFTMTVAPAVQSLLGQLEPSAIVHEAAGRGFPLAVEEMAWQLEFLRKAPLDVAMLAAKP